MIDRRGVILVIAIAGIGFVVAAQYVWKPAVVSSLLPPLINRQNCNPQVMAALKTLWTHVYHPKRLKVIEECKMIGGILINAIREKDGDWHMRILTEDKDLINQANMDHQHSYLVAEPICQGWQMQPDSIEPCKGYNGPRYQSFDQYVGKKIKVVGSFVEDQEHFSWREIHPVQDISLEDQ